MTRDRTGATFLSGDESGKVSVCSVAATTTGEGGKRNRRRQRRRVRDRITLPHEINMTHVGFAPAGIEGGGRMGGGL